MLEVHIRRSIALSFCIRYVCIFLLWQTFVFLSIYESVHCEFWFICPGECSGLSILVKEVSLTFYVCEGEELTFCRIYNCSSYWQQSIYFNIADCSIKMHENVYAPQQKYRLVWVFFINVTDPHIPLIWSEGKTIFLVKRQNHESGPGSNWYFNQAISISFCHLQYLKLFILFIL